MRMRELARVKVIIIRLDTTDGYYRRQVEFKSGVEYVPAIN